MFTSRFAATAVPSTAFPLPSADRMCPLVSVPVVWSSFPPDPLSAVIAVPITRLAFTLPLPEYVSDPPVPTVIVAALLVPELTCPKEGKAPAPPQEEDQTA